MKKLNGGIRRSICTLAIVAILAAGRTLLAQAPGPPDGMEPPPNMQPPKMNIDKELSRMTKRYGLSDAQNANLDSLRAQSSRGH